MYESYFGKKKDIIRLLEEVEKYPSTSNFKQEMNGVMLRVGLWSY